MFQRRFRQRLLHILFVYVILQLFWWGVQLYRSYKILYPNENQAFNKLGMIIGEGAVFSVLLFLGFRWINKSIKKEMESATVEKTFLLSVTHELKTPIASIRLMLDTLTRHKTEEEKQKVILSQAQGELTRLQKQIENILLTSRTATGRFENHDQLIQLSEFVDVELKKIRKWYPDHEFDIQIDAASKLQIDPELLGSVFFNLIDNACKYSPNNSKIIISSKRIEGNISIQILDEGKGVSEEESKLMTQKFYRNAQVADQINGSGLGLYLVSNIVRFYRGSISFSNRKTGGTCAEVILPL
jgi:two-component system phosphate regulon sensor histidine kinase PhoR